MNIEPEVRDWLAALELAEAVAERNTAKVAAVYADAMSSDPPRMVQLLRRSSMSPHLTRTASPNSDAKSIWWSSSRSPRA